ncbi:MAG: HAD domain-containing protein [Burkholderiaceae bacterium]
MIRRLDGVPKIYAGDFKHLQRCIAKMPSRPIVFLDIDDVLCLNSHYNGQSAASAAKAHLAGEHHEVVGDLWATVFDAEAVSAMLILNDIAKPHYVISSTWAQYGRPLLSEIFRRTGLGVVADNLHADWLTPRRVDSNRVSEIRWWLDGHAEVRESGFYLVLDDEISGPSLQCGTEARESGIEHHTFLCKANEGLTLDALYRASGILSLPVGQFMVQHEREERARKRRPK